MSATTNLKEQITAVGKNFAKGFTHNQLENQIPGATKEDLANVINQLLQANVLELLTGKNGVIVYRMKQANQGPLKGLDESETIVYQVIASAGNKGSSLMQIQNASNIKSNLQKILKKLVNKRLLKTVKSVKNPLRKIYMLYNLTPHEEVTGGKWYNENQEFEAEFVKVLQAQALNFLKRKSLEVTASSGFADSITSLRHLHKARCSAEEVLQEIMKSKVIKVDLTPKNIESILDTLDYKGFLEVTSVSQPSGESVRKFRYKKPGVKQSYLTMSPCCLCPSVEICTPGGSVSPEGCVYMKDWLEF